MLNKIFKTELFLGKGKQNYFEGWYFKHNSVDLNFAFIVGITTFIKDPHAFIQYIDDNSSHYFRYPIQDFNCHLDQVIIQIADNIFSLQGIKFNCQFMNVDIKYHDVNIFKKSISTPSAMGLFGYLPNNCKHAILSFNHLVSGDICINKKNYKIKGNGYIEKDYGTKFPENYFWCQGQNDEVSVVFALAYPLIFNIKGYLCFINFNNEQHNLSLYTNAKLKLVKITDSLARIIIKKGKEKIILLIENNIEQNQILLAPNTNGQMNIEVKENLKANMKVLYRKKHRVYNYNLPCAYELSLKDSLHADN